MIVKITTTHERAVIPCYATSGSAASDLHIILDEAVTLQPGEIYVAKTGLALELPEGYVAIICARSGLSTKHGICLANGVGVIDSDYRGEIHVCLYNRSRLAFELTDGMRAAQMMIMPVTRAEFQKVESINETDRGTGGFGSTGL